jgi:hypothetical protein
LADVRAREQAQEQLFATFERLLSREPICRTALLSNTKGALQKFQNGFSLAINAKFLEKVNVLKVDKYLFYSEYKKTLVGCSWN